MFQAQIFARTLTPGGQPDAITRVRSGHRNIFAFLQDRARVRVVVAARVSHDPGLRPDFVWTGDTAPRLSISAYGAPGLPFALPFLRTRRSTTTYRLWLFPVTSAGTRRLEIRDPRKRDAKMPAQRLILRSFKQRTKKPDLAALHKEITARSKNALEERGAVELYLHQLLLAESTRSDAILALEARIYLFAVTYRNFDDVKRAVGTLERLCAQSGQGDRFTAFMAHLAERMAPRGIGAHGYTVQMAGRDQAEVLNGLSPLIDAIEAEGYPVMINSGTLLGFRRDGAMIPHDDDVDLAVHYGEGDPGVIAERQKALFDRLSSRFDLQWKSDYGFFGFRAKDGPMSDFFPAWTRDGAFFVYPYSHGDIRAEDVVPFERHPWLGTSIRTPRDIDAVLGVNYGPGWRTPDPTWKFDWPRAERRFAPFLRTALQVHEADLRKDRVAQGDVRR